MAASEEEKRIARAYNVGTILSIYEPKLLEQIIRNNKNNAFVRTMAIAKDHNEFSQGIPRKDFNTEYKNGFNNAHALSKQDPKLLDKMLSSKELHNDFKRGLADGKHEYKIRESMNRMKEEREAKQRNIDKDYGIGY
ncbi:hypothetical protein [Mucilaginibacter pedocola]|uniref:Uncharacterized protein n=1 Tax=Mucilaginibacter pedocola TaxID=1792845 RepID=A0A1S9PML4_9SPHI|nr:hypothetical protein [Mucilaginibacter pedocola]OOQ62186.1 hypothetical protein BC343_03845 [Mucilaginibacter pedocola]